MAWYFALAPVIGTFMLCQLSPKFNYYFKFAVYFVGLMAIGFILLPVVIVRRNAVKNIKLVSEWEVALTKLLGVSLDFNGMHYLTEVGGSIIVLNHQSALDTTGALALIATVTGKSFVIGKKSILFFPWFGLLHFLIGGVIFINRSNRTQARQAVNATALRAKKEDSKLAIFPEGTRHKGQTLLPFKNGAFYCAIENQMPIIPVVISPYSFVDDEKKIFNRGTVTVSVMPPIYPKDFGDMNPQELADKTRDLMQTEYEKLWEKHMPKSK